MKQPMQLQVNQSGAWRGVLTFCHAEAPPEFFETACNLVRLSGVDATLRIVTCERGGNGTYKPTNTVLWRWSRKTNWVAPT